MPRQKGSTSSLEGWMMINGKTGESFYSEKIDRALTAIAVFYKRKIITERTIAVQAQKKGKEIKAVYITKVTFL